MVNFDSDSAVSTPPGDIFKIVVLERREQVIEALENYHSAAANGIEIGNRLAVLQARTIAFWYQIQAMVRRRMDTTRKKKDALTYEEISRGMNRAKTFPELVEAFEWMNQFVDEMGLTKIDTRKNYDDFDIEEANELEGR